MEKCGNSRHDGKHRKETDTPTVKNEGQTVTWTINWELYAHELKTPQTACRKKMNLTHGHNIYDKTSKYLPLP